MKHRVVFLLAVVFTFSALVAPITFGQLEGGAWTALLGWCPLAVDGSEIEARYTNILNQIHNETLYIEKYNPAHFYTMVVNPSRTELTVSIFKGPNGSNAKMLATRTCGT